MQWTMTNHLITLMVSYPRLVLSEAEAMDRDNSPEHMNGAPVRGGSDGLWRLAAADGLHLSALLVVSEAWPVGDTAPFHAATVPHLHGAVIGACHKVTVVFTHSDPTATFQCHWCHFISKSISVRDWITKRAWKRERERERGERERERERRAREKGEREKGEWERASEWVSEWVSEWLSEWVSEWMSEWMNEWVIYWVRWTDGRTDGQTDRQSDRVTKWQSLRASLQPHLLTAPRCSCRWATSCPLGLQLAGEGALVSHAVADSRSLVSWLLANCTRFLCTSCCRSTLHAAHRTGTQHLTLSRVHTALQHKLSLVHAAATMWNDLPIMVSLDDGF